MTTSDIDSLVILVKTNNDGKVRQILLSEQQKEIVLSAIFASSKDGHINILDKPIDGIELTKTDKKDK